jgi:hypothetical protein
MFKNDWGVAAYFKYLSLYFRVVTEGNNDNVVQNIQCRGSDSPDSNLRFPDYETRILAIT